MRSAADFNAVTGRRRNFRAGRSLYKVSDVTRAGFDEVDFGWGKPAYGGPGEGCDTKSSKLLSTVDQGVKGIFVPIALPIEAMEIFHRELKRMLNQIPASL
ncbi:Methanol O-anthraniloyltransferase [Linum grandiflorum]